MDEAPEKEQQILERVRQQLDKAEAALDTATRRDLHRARQQALAQLQQPRRIWQPVSLAAAMAGTAALAVGLYIMQPAPRDTATGIEDMQLLSTSDDLELYENLEFYQWLEFEARSG